MTEDDCPEILPEDSAVECQPVDPGEDVSPPGPVGPEEVKSPLGTGDYEVGYRRPPVSTRFKPGQIGNPAGRPKGSLNLKTLLMEKLNERVAVTESGKKKRMSKAEVGITKTVNNFVLKGDLRALAFFIEKLGLEGPGGAAHESIDQVDDASDRAKLEFYLQQELARTTDETSD